MEARVLFLLERSVVFQRFFEDGQHNAAKDGTDENGGKVQEWVANGGNDEDAAMGCPKRAAKSHRQCSSRC